MTISKSIEATPSQIEALYWIGQIRGFEQQPFDAITLDGAAYLARDR